VMMMIRKREEGWISNVDDRCKRVTVSEMTRLSSSLTWQSSKYVLVFLNILNFIFSIFYSLNL
jgi:hypothetical protein